MTAIDVNSAFTNVDTATDPSRFVRQLDEVRAVASGHPYRVRKFQILDVRPGMRVLDIGCGSGSDLADLAAMVGTDGLVVGIDRSEVMLAEARQRCEEAGLRVELRLGDACQLDAADASFDRCHAERLFHHLEEPERALAELVRVLKPSGRLVAIDPDFDTVFVDSPDRDLTRKVLHLSTDWVRNGWMGRRLRRLFLDGGLVEVTCEAFVLALTDFAAGSQLLWLERTARRAVEEGLLQLEDVEAWLAQLQSLDRNGRFFSGATGFVTSGRKP